jgi:hypothetical protein
VSLPTSSAAKMAPERPAHRRGLRADEPGSSDGRADDGAGTASQQMDEGQGGALLAARAGNPRKRPVAVTSDESCGQGARPCGASHTPQRRRHAIWTCHPTWPRRQQARRAAWTASSCHRRRHGRQHLWQLLQRISTCRCSGSAPRRCSWARASDRSPPASPPSRARARTASSSPFAALLPSCGMTVRTRSRPRARAARPTFAAARAVGAAGAMAAACAQAPPPEWLPEQPVAAAHAPVRASPAAVCSRSRAAAGAAAEAAAGSRRCLWRPAEAATRRAQLGSCWSRPDASWSGVGRVFGGRFGAMPVFMEKSWD